MRVGASWRRRRAEGTFSPVVFLSGVETSYEPITSWSL
jgi:hypothetical protein